jgi:hypothetical protein
LFFRLESSLDARHELAHNECRISRQPPLGTESEGSTVETMLLDRDQSLQGFESFRQTILSSEPPFETKQDNFDWECEQQR